MFTSFCHAGPAVTPSYKTDVEDEENGKQIVCYSNSYWRAVEAPFEFLRMSDLIPYSQTKAVINGEQESLKEFEKMGIILRIKQL